MNECSGSIRETHASVRRDDETRNATGGEGRGWTADEREARWRDGKNETEGKIDTGVGNKARGRTGVPGEGEGTMQRAEEGIRDRLS